MAEPLKRSHIAVIGFGIYSVSTLLSMAVMNIGVGVMIICMVAAAGWKGFFSGVLEEFNRRANRHFLWVSLFLVMACAISLLGAILFPVYYNGQSAEIHFLDDMRKAWYFLLPVLIVSILRRLDRNEQGAILRAWFVAFGVLSVLGIIQYFIGWPRPQFIPTSPARFHVTLFLGHHLSVASIFIFPFFAVLDLPAKENGPQICRLPRSVLWFFALAGVLALFLTYSRTLWIALPLGILIWILQALPRRWIAVTLIGFAVIGLAVSRTPAFLERMKTPLGITSRMDLWEANWDFFKARPLNGVGWKKNHDLSGPYLLEKNPQLTSVFAGHAHNNVIDMLGGLGLFGLLTWLIWCASIFWFLLKMALEKGFHGFPFGLLCAWIVFHLNGMTQLNFWEGKVLHQMMWAVVWSLLWIGTTAQDNTTRV